MWKPNIKGLADKVKSAGSKTVSIGKDLGSKAKNIGKSSVGSVKGAAKKLNPFKK
jgi:glycerate-2-kinase